MKGPSQQQRYWQKNLQYLTSLLLIWFTVSYGFGILLAEPLNTIRIGGFKLGFWFAQQGSIYTFVALIFIYVLLMNRLDKAFASESIPPVLWYFKWRSIWVSLVLCALLLLVTKPWVASRAALGNFIPMALIILGCAAVVVVAGLRKRADEGENTQELP